MPDEKPVVETPEVPETPEEKMIPESRLKGIVKEKASLEQTVKRLQAQLDAKATEGLSEVERLKAEKEAMTLEIAARDEAVKAKDQHVKRLAVKAHLTDAISPAVLGTVPMDIVEVDESGELTAASKKALKEWKSKPDISPLFTPARPGGNTPAPTDSSPEATKAKYYQTVADPNATPAQKQAALEAYRRSMARK